MRRGPQPPPAVAPHVAAAERYVAGVLDGTIPACKWTRRACERHRADIARARTGWRYHFDYARAERACSIIELLPHIKGEKAKRSELIVLGDWQCFIVVSIFGWVDRKTGLRRFRKAYIEVARKNGKMLADDTPVPTPTGWKRHGDLVAGDEVFAPSGKPIKVLATTGSYDGPGYQVQFSDGTSIVAHERHEWKTERKIFTGRRRGPNCGELPIVETGRIRETLRAGARGDLVHRIPVAAPIELPESALPIDPYVLGVWLGDGHSASARLTCFDEEIIDNLRARGCEVEAEPCGRHLFLMGRGKLQTTLRAHGLLNNKHIPAAYLRASVQQRLDLVRGLMDTDGTISSRGQCEFAQIRKGLAEQAMELIRSLGWKPTLRIVRASCNGKDCGENYRIQFKACAERSPFALSRKSARLSEARAINTRSRSRSIVAVEPIGTITGQCIQVEGGLYLAGDGFIATHNSTLLAAILVVLTFFDGEAGADGFSAATTRDQARIVFRTAQEMIRKSPELRERYGVELLAHAVVQETSGSKLEALSADAHTLDGLNPHASVVDELHAHKTRKVYDVIETAMGARAQPLLVVITTAGDDIAGICYEVRTYVTKILDQVADDDSTFGVIYTVDETDDWTSELAWRKANPNYGVSVYPEYLADLARKAIQTPAAQANFKTKHLDVWVSSNAALYSVEAWRACARPDLTRDDLQDFACITGVDLASTNDLCSAYDVYRDDSADEPVFYVLGRNYVPEDTIAASRIAQYPGWDQTERLIATPGDSTDYQRIEDDILEQPPADRREIVLDKYQSRHLATRLQAEGVTVVELAMNVSTLSEPTKMLDVLMRRQRILHDGDPVLEWAISNVVGHIDAKDNVYPRKERPENKIDPAIAVLMALSRWLSSEISGPTVIETEGIRFA